MVKALHAAGIEVILDVVYNHTAEGNHLGPTLSFRGIDNAAYYRLVEDDQQLLHGLHRHRQLPQRPPPALAAADHGLAALLGHRDARRRLPLRPRLDAGPRVLRRRPAGDVLRARAAGPGRQPGQADRRAVGRRPRRLPGRQLPAAVDRVERQVPRHRARLLARRAVAGRVRLAGWPGRPTSTSTPGAARSRASTSSPPTTASRCATWCPTTRSTTTPTARTATTARATTARGTAASRGRPTTRRSSSRRARAQRNFLATLLLSQGVPMLAARRRARPHPARQQQHLRPGHRDQLGALGRGRPAAGASSPPRSSRLRAKHPTFRRKRFFTGSTVRTEGRRASGSTTSSGCTPTAGRWRTATGRPAARRPSGCTSTATASPARDARGDAHRRRPLPALLQRRRRAGRGHACPPEEYAAAWDVVDRHRRRAATDGARARGRHDARPCTAAAWWCCASTRADARARRSASPPRVAAVARSTPQADRARHGADIEDG